MAADNFELLYYYQQEIILQDSNEFDQTVIRLGLRWKNMPIAV
jgi:hypothetical protein